jgi:hypothetical protein
MLQGRVQLDADWNEQNDIQFHYEKEYLKDLIGKNGTLAKNNGFAISPSGNGFLIDPGHYYVDGIMCENESAVEYSEQPDVLQHSTFVAGDYLIYLKVWERFITHLDDRYIREQALGNVDTAARMKIVWQVLTFKASEPITDKCKIWEEALKQIELQTTGTLEARAKPSPQSTDKCSLYETAGYTRLENQLYRIEVHDAGDLGTATFKWSRENGAVVSKVAKYESVITFVIEKRGKDDLLDFKKDDWVEITDDLNELHGIPGTFVQLDKVEDTTITFNAATRRPAGATPFETLYPLSRNPKIRRWESIADNPLIDSSTSKDPDGYIELEDGVQVILSDGNYRTGDYWCVPARTREGKVEWATDSSDKPVALGPAGIQYHYAPLALLHHNGGNFEAKWDLRSFFSSLTELIAMHYAGGDGQQALPDNKLAAPLRVSVTLGDRPIHMTPMSGALVRFTIDKQSQLTPGSLRALPSGPSSDQSVDVPTNHDTGLAECEWTLGDNMEQQQVKAELYDECGNKVNNVAPLYFNATLRLSLYYISGDGVEAKTSDPVRLSTGIMLGKEPFSEDYKVQFEVVEGGLLQLVGGGPAVPIVSVDPDSAGIAAVNYLDTAENPRKQAKAILLHKDGSKVNERPIYFNVTPLHPDKDATDFDKFIECKPDFILTNGLAYNYMPSIGSASPIPLNNDAEIFKARPGELTRWYIVNAGPRKQVFFQFPTLPLSGQPKYKGISTIPPLSTSIVEATFLQDVVYVEMDGDLGHFLKGSGFYVLATTDSTEDDHPKRSKIVELELEPPEGHTKQLILRAERKKVQVVPDNPLRPGGLEYNAIVLVGSLPSQENPINDSIPGPVVGVNQNDILEVTVENNTGQIISLIFSGLEPDGSTGNIGPGESKSVTFRCTKPGLFPYYGAGDALNGIWEHVWSGMYGAIVVHPENEAPAKEFCVIFSELYSSEIKGLFR